MKIIGNNKARYRYGFNISADWKGFDLGIFFQGVGKRDLGSDRSRSALQGERAEAVRK